MIKTLKEVEPFVNDRVQQGINNLMRLNGGRDLLRAIGRMEDEKALAMLCGISLLVCSLILDPIQRTERPNVGKRRKS